MGQKNDASVNCCLHDYEKWRALRPARPAGAQIPSPGGKVARHKPGRKRNAGRNVLVFEGDQTYVQVCFCSKTVRFPPEFLFRLALLGTFSPGEGLRLRRCKQQFISQSTVQKHLTFVGKYALIMETVEDV